MLPLLSPFTSSLTFSRNSGSVGSPLEDGMVRVCEAAGITGTRLRGTKEARWSSKARERLLSSVMREGETRIESCSRNGVDLTKGAMVGMGVVILGTIEYIGCNKRLTLIRS